MGNKIVEKEKKRKKWKRLRGRIFFFTVTFMILFLWIFNNHCAEKGVPEWVRHALSCPLERAGISIEAEHVTFSFTKGLYFKNFKYSEVPSGIQLSAPVVYVEIFPLKLFKGISLPVYFVIKDGTATLPILPETGEEGKTDCLHFKKLNTEIRGIKGKLEVEQASAEISNVSVQMKGTVDNFLHIMLENIFSDYWEQDKSGEKWRKKKYPYGFMQMFPMEIRKKFVQSYHHFESLEMKDSAKCNIQFHIDMNDFEKCRIASDITLPEFRFKNLNVYETKEQISLNNGILELKEVALDLGKGSSLTASGTYYDKKSVFSGKIKGECYISDLIHFADPELAEVFRKHIVFENKKIAFEGFLEHFSISGNRYKGKLNLVLPKITVDGVVMKNVNLLVQADEKKFQGEIRGAEIDGGKISGTFTIYDSGEVVCEIRGKSSLFTFNEVLPQEAGTFLRKKISFSRQESPIEFSGTFRSDSRKMKQYSGSAKVKYPHVRFNGVEIRDIEAELEFTPERIHFSKIEAKGADSSKFSGSMLFDLKKNHIISKIVASGIPGNLAKMIDTVWQTDLLVPLAKDISSSDPNSIVETDVELFADYGKTPFFQIGGNVVMRKPTYCGVPFEYGAARFIADSNGKLIIPDLILKAKDGSLQLEAINVGNTDPRQKDDLHFKLQSTIRGNDLMKVFGPECDLELIRFPFPIKVTANGIMNYTDPKKTALKAVIHNGSCTFAGAKVTDIDCIMHIKNEEIIIRDADATFCKGSCKVDFKYNLDTEKGSFKQTLHGADLASVLKEFQLVKLLPPETGDGKLDFCSEGNFEYKDKGEDISIYGKGKLDLSGNLWNIPVVNDFLKYIVNAWPMLGKSPGITKISCDILFDDGIAKVGRINANGDIVSMDASGAFELNTGKYDITIQAKLLKSMLPLNAMSTILTPLTKMLDKNYKGTFTIPSGKQ